MQDAYAEDRHGNRRRIKRGDVLMDGERLIVPAQFMDSDDTSFGFSRTFSDGSVDHTDPHRPGFRFADSNDPHRLKAEEAYQERTRRMQDAWKKKKRAPDDDDEDEEDRLSERQRRELLARKAARATMGSDARQLTDAEARAAADAAWEERNERLRNGWRNRA
jgi:hypothetical protein